MSLTILFLILYGVSASRNERAPQIEIGQGVLQGKTLKTRQGREINAFMSIPYAKPPLGQLRFAPPVPAGPWEGILDATKVHVKCPQQQVYTNNDAIEGDEDCLYINVYTPKLPDSSGALLPVMIFVHGGGFSTGSGSYDYYRPDILLDKGIVLVAFNYRLGILGFVTTEDAVAPGNNGLKDQNLAIRWTKGNVAKFGGDPEKITLFGQSAGSIAVHLHMLSLQSEGLFQRAISESGTALNSWTFDSGHEVARYSKDVALYVKCPTTPSQKMIDCLRKVHPYTMIAQYNKLREWDIDPSILFKPVIEPNLPGAFITEHPKDLIRSGRYAGIPWILGINTEEGSLRAAGIYSDPSLVEEYDRDFDRIAPISLAYEDASNRDRISRKIREFYFGQKRIDSSTRLNFIDMYTDARFLSGVDQAVRLHTTSSRQKVFYYLFGHRGEVSYSELIGGGSKNYGVCHCDELQYLFPVNETFFPSGKADVFDQRITETLITLWTSFAKTGTPRPDKNTSAFSPPWEPVRSNSLEYYFIGSNTHMSKNMLAERVQFWRNVSESLD